MMTARIHKGGYFVVLVLVFGSVFLTIVGGLTGFIFQQKRAEVVAEYREAAIQIAEAGLDYYKWFLAHNPENTTDGTGLPGPYVHDYSDPEGGAFGKFSLDITTTTKCGTLAGIKISSTGSTNAEPIYTRTVTGNYARPSVADYAYILNSNVWAGADRIIVGKYHSNGGIRMDGTNQSTVSSAVSTWQCSGSFGCNPTQTKPGVWGAGPNNTLWSFPVPPIDFAGLTVDLNTMKSKAQESGLFFGPVGGESNQRGYHAIFKNNGTVDVYRVTNTSNVWGYNQQNDTQNGWKREYDIITDKTFLGNYVIPSSCSLVFFEDKLWLEGVVSGKITIASADTSQPNYDTDVVLLNDLTYAGPSTEHGATVIAEKNVRIPLLSPNNMQLNGIFIAQKGYFGRNYYTSSGSHEVPSSYDSNVKQDTLTLSGTIVSNGREGTKWSCGGVYCSGYAERTNTYDRNLALDPPPLTPYTSPDYTFVEWREQN